MPRRSAFLLAGLLASALGAQPASALQALSGEWTGTAVCDTAMAEGVQHTKSAFTMGIDDNGSGTALALVAGKVVARVAVVADPGDSGRGRIGGVACGLPGDVEFVFQLAAKAKDGSAEATLQGESISIDFGAARSVGVCKLKLTRTSATVGAPIECPN